MGHGRRKWGLKCAQNPILAVRKAQLKLATYYILHDATELAMLIREDFADEPEERLKSIRAELESVVSETFWELEDRGYNFEFIEDRRKARRSAAHFVPGSPHVLLS